MVDFTTCRTRLHLSSIILLALLLFFPPTLRAQGRDFSQSAKRADFKEFCDDFQENYAYLDRPEKPWKTWNSRYAAIIDAVSTPEAYAAVLESALDELHDFHAEVRSPNPHRWLPVPTFADVWAEFRGKNAVVIAVRRGSDAERAGIMPGDRVIEISGVSLPSAIADRLTPAVNNDDPKARQWALLSLLTGRADEARSITVQHANGKIQMVLLPLERRFDRAPDLLTATILPGNIGLIRVQNSLGEQKTVNAFDAALRQLRLTHGLILDLRDVPSGGDSSIALGIMGRFVTRMLPYQHHRIPNYGQSDVERNWLELVAPRGPFTYKAPVAVLVDHWTGSMGEGMAIGFDAMRRARVIGTPMAHLAGAVSDFTLPRTGMDVAFATEQIYHINGTPRQAWLPPVLIEGPISIANDVILNRGLAYLRRRR